MEMEAMLQNMLQGIMRLEILCRATVDALAKKTGADGKPLLTREEVNAEAELIKAEIIENAKAQSQIIKPSVIIPPGV